MGANLQNWLELQGKTAVGGARRYVGPATLGLLLGLTAGLAAQSPSRDSSQPGQNQTAAQQSKPAQPQAAQPPAPKPQATQPQATQPAPPQTGKPSAPGTANPPAKPITPPTPVASAVTPADYIIGPDDVLQIVFWREKDLSAEVVVRPDGKISLSLLNDVQAAGLTPDQLRQQVTTSAARYVTDPSVTVIVKTINSRRVFVTGMVNKPGTYPLNDQMTVLQMLAVAGGLGEFAKGKDIVVMRTEQGQTKSYKFNYNDVRQGKKLEQNITLRPGDTIVVP